MIYLNSFRGLPAICQFDWPFTPLPQFIGVYCYKLPFSPFPWSW